MMANKTGAIVLTADATNPDVTAPIIFDRIATQQPAYLAMNSNATGVGTGSNQVTVMNSLRTAYDDVAANGLYLYGNGVLGNQPVAKFVEQGLSGRLNIISPQVNISTLNSLNIIGVSTINGQPVGSGSSGGNVFSTLYVTSTAFVSSLIVSSINGAEFTSTAITVPTISAEVANLAKAALSTVQFNPSVGGITPNIDLGMGGFLGGVAGGLGSGVFNTALGVTALATGIAGLTMPRTIVNGNNTNINPNAFELINGTTQLQVSTLLTASSNVLRLVSSSAANVPGREYFVSSIIAPGTTCIRSLSDPLNLANSTIVTSSLQSFGQWVPLPTGGGGGGSNVIPDLVVSSINSISWDQIQYANQQPVSEPGSFIVVDATNQYLYVGATILSPVPTYESQELVLDPGTYTLSEFVDMLDAAGSSQGVAAGQLRFGLSGGNISVSLNVNTLLPFAQTYLLIWNPTAPPNFPFASFAPPITAPALLASSALFGSLQTNILLQTISGGTPQTLPAAPTLTPNPVGPISFGANLQVSSIAFARNTGSNAGAIQINGLLSMYDLPNHTGLGIAYTFNPYTTLNGGFGTLLSVNAPNGSNQCALAADNTIGSQIRATSNNAPGPLSVIASQMNVSSIFLSSINGAVYPPPASQTISTFQTLATSSFTVSSINGGPPGGGTNVYQNLFTSTFNVSTINGVNWSTISLQNQAPTIVQGARNWVVTSSNNIICLTVSVSLALSYFIIPLTIGTYDNTSFPIMVNAAIQTFAATQMPLFGISALSYFITNVSGNVYSNFSIGGTAPINNAYYPDWDPANVASYPPTTLAQLLASSVLFGADSEYFTLKRGSSNPVLTVELPTANTNFVTNPPRPFGADLQVSSINIQGIPVSPSGGNPVGSIIAFGGVAAPTGYLICDGAIYASTSYPALFSVIGYAYGGSAGNFNVPDLQTRQPMGSIAPSTPPVSCRMQLPNVGFATNVVIIQTVAGGAVSTNNPRNIIVPGCVFTAPGVGPYTVASVMYADYGRSVYLVQLNVNLGGAGQVYTGSCAFPDIGVGSPNTTQQYKPGFQTPAYYAPSLSQSQMPTHTHNYNLKVGGLATTVVANAVAPVGNPNNFYETDTTSNGGQDQAANPGGVGFNTGIYNFPAGLIGPNPNVPLGVQPLPFVAVNYIIKT
jgi:microcystin-dependent protein